MMGKSWDMIWKWLSMGSNGAKRGSNFQTTCLSQLNLPELMSFIHQVPSFRHRANIFADRTHPHQLTALTAQGTAQSFHFFIGKNQYPNGYNGWFFEGMLEGPSVPRATSEQKLGSCGPAAFPLASRSCDVADKTEMPWQWIFHGKINGFQSFPSNPKPSRQVHNFHHVTSKLHSLRPDLPVPCNIDLRGLGRSKLVGFSHRPRRPRLLPRGPTFSTFKELNPPAACRRSAKDLPPPAPRGRQLPWWKVIETDETTWMCPSIELPMATPKSSTLGFSIAIHPFGVQYPCFRKPPRVYRDQILYLL